jgi:hypothetical protein
MITRASLSMSTDEVLQEAAQVLVTIRAHRQG